MSKTSFSSTPSLASVTLYKGWAEGLSNALTTVGCVKTADTGQIDWSSISAAPTATNFSGYEIRQLPAGTLQTANPILMKIEYGSQSGYCAIKITVGHETDGAGNFIGFTATQIALYVAGTSATPFNSYVSCAEDYITFALFANTTSNSYPIAFYISRARDANGVALDTGVTIVSQRPGAVTQQWLPKNGSPFPYAPTSKLCCASPSAGTGTYNDAVGVFPVFIYLGSSVYPDTVGIGFFSADFAGAGGSIFTLDLLGVSHDYVALGQGGVYGLGGNSYSALMVRWE